MSKLLLLAAAGALASTASGAASAAPTRLSDAQLDGVIAGAQPTSAGFVCPVVTTAAVLNSPNGSAISNGDYTILGPNVDVPTRATNLDGAGDPGGTHASPGDASYSPIWPNR